MSLMLWSEKCARGSSESSLAVFWLYCRWNIQCGLFQIFFYDGMFCVGIAATLMNSFKGNLYNFASVAQRFLRQHTLQTSQLNSVRRTVVHKSFNSSSSKMFTLWFLACSPWNYLDSWKATLQLLLASVLRYQKSLYHCQVAQWSLKTMFLPAGRSHGCLDSPYLVLIPFLFCMLHSIVEFLYWTQKCLMKTCGVSIMACMPRLGAQVLFSLSVVLRFSLIFWNSGKI